MTFWDTKKLHLEYEMRWKLSLQSVTVFRNPLLNKDVEKAGEICPMQAMFCDLTVSILKGVSVALDTRKLKAQESTTEEATCWNIIQQCSNRSGL